MAWRLRPVWATLAAWDKAGYVEEGPRWENTRTLVAGLLEDDDTHPDALFSAGRLYEWRALQQRLTPIEAGAQVRTAEGYFLAALRVRPTWGAAWSHLARVRWQDGTDEAFSRALAGAIRYAPWEPDTQLDVAWLALHGWARLNSREQAAAREYLAHVARNPLQRGKLEEFAFLARQPDLYREAMRDAGAL